MRMFSLSRTVDLLRASGRGRQSQPPERNVGVPHGHHIVFGRTVHFAGLDLYRAIPIRGRVADPDQRCAELNAIGPKGAEHGYSG